MLLQACRTWHTLGGEANNMPIDYFPIFGELHVRPTPDSRRRLAALGISSVGVQNRCYGTLAEGLGASERAKRVESLSGAALRADYLASQQSDSKQSGSPIVPPEFHI